jgi:orotidine-5'-phosphate decarboxylase
MATVIVALDLAEPDDARSMIDATRAGAYKIGLELLHHPDGVRLAAEIAADWPLFLDAKLSDIPTTVARAVDQICRHIRPAMLSVRTAIPEAIEAAAGRTMIVHVPSLTSDPRIDAQRTLAPGYVCGPALAGSVRALNPTATIICPGVRLSLDAPDDHLAPWGVPAAADYIVIGRPITRATDPAAALARYVSAAASIDHQ